MLASSVLKTNLKASREYQIKLIQLIKRQSFSIIASDHWLVCRLLAQKQVRSDESLLQQPKETSKYKLKDLHRG